MKRAADKRNSKSKQHRQSGGFTTVELIVVIAIVMILAGFVATGLVKWIEWSHFKQENERARSIFVAAQNQLNEYAAGGSLEELQQTLRGRDGTYENLVPLELLTDTEGNQYDLETILKKVWPESADKGQYAGKYREDICYLMGTAQDYQDYLAGRASAQVRVLYDMLTSYLYDTSLLNAAVCIEFTPGDGQVFSVLYSSRQDGFSYDDGDGRTNISNRTADYRRSLLVGYYGVDTLYMATTTKQEKPSISGVRLNNEETLNLTFYLSRIKEATQELTYQIAVRDKHSDDNRMVISLDGTKLKNTPSEILCGVSTGSGGTERQEKYGVIAWVDSQNIIHVILDAADLTASSELYYKAYPGLRGGSGEPGSAEAFRNTQSFHRFGIDTEDIVCVVGGKGTFYKDTAQKKSNDQNTYFGSCKKADDGTVDYTISNARHLYNLRYVEDYTEAQRQGEGYTSLLTGKVNYEIRNDIDWREFIRGGFLYHSAQNKDWAIGVRQLGEDLVTDLQTAFPSFRQLRGTSVLTGGRDGSSVSGLTITREANADGGVYGGTYEGNAYDRDGQPTGLFVTNYGVIRSMSLDRVTVKGAGRTGAYCGQNAGSLFELTVEDSGRTSGIPSQVSGTQDVGGIAGYQMGTENAGESGQASFLYEELTNRSKVSGNKYVGGIVGRLTAEGGRSVTVDSCLNYGRVEAAEYEGGRNDGLALQSSYIGGIVGYCYNKAAAGDAGKLGQLTISRCTSSPQYTAGEIEDLIAYPEKLGKKLNGLFVGGIVGYSENCMITACSASGEKNQPGYLFGMMYVGGIAGFCEGPEGSILDGSDGTGEYGVNDSNVIGGMYVGGIVGCNADGFYEEWGTGAVSISHKDVRFPSDYLMSVFPVSKFSMNMKIANWMNKGTVLAAGKTKKYNVSTDGYAGGITGFNAGWVYHCNSETGNSRILETLADCGGFDSRYAGGIAGSNYGILGNTQRDAQGRIVEGSGQPTDEQRRLYTVCRVYGNSLVGGIAGYNAVDAVIEDYAVAGGYINATGSYVGGYAGFNASRYLLEKESGEGRVIYSNPNEVTGAYCVGGIIGGNAIVLQDDETVSAVFKADNFLGKLSASAFAGGYIGFNATVRPIETVGGSTSAESANITILSRVLTSLKILDDLYRAEDIDKEEASDKETRLSYVLDMMATWHTQGIKETSGVVHITGNPGDGVTGEETATQLGGINAEIYAAGVVGYNNSNSYLKISNVINQTPVKATYAIENKTEQAGKTYQGQAYTYSYAGGIIGKVGSTVTVENCRNQGVGDVTAVGTYTGGLCEINEGLIINCQVSSVGEAAVDYVGGIAGLNKSGGRIENCIFAGRTITGRNYVGGIAAENYGLIINPRLGSTEEADKGIQVSGASINAYGSQGQGYAGGVAGRNYGSGSIQLSGGAGLLVAVTSTGSNVGGVAGSNEGSIRVGTSSDGSSVVSINGSVTGYQNVGGLIGLNSKSADSQGLKGYVNAASVTAGYGAAGGITGQNADQETAIINCTNTGEINAPNAGDAGGILGGNKGTVSGCMNTGRVSAPNGICGGIAGTNDGTILDSRVNSPQESRLEFTGSLYVGGICGVNSGVISGGSVGGLKLQNLSGSTGGAVGGVTGENRGENALIQNVSVGAGPALGGLSDADKVNRNKNGDMLVLVSSASDVDMGGVAGRNSGTVAGGNGSDPDLTEAYTPVYADLSFYETSMSYYGNFGGIAGVNGGTIQGYEFNGAVTGTANNPQMAPEYNPNTDYETSGAAIYGYGGIAGVNGSSEALIRASITGCRVNIASVTGLGDANNIANIGGIAGVNGLGAEITGAAFGSAAVYKLHNSSSRIKEVTDAVGNPTASVFVGTVGTVKANSTDYAHTGGVAGLNSGKITQIGMEPGAGEAQDGWQVTEEMDSSLVLVENFRGHVGGITGYNRRTGVVEKAATGRKWIVFAPQNAQDNGCGGIAGYSASENGLQYCSNGAAVVKETSASNGVGGMIGRLECATSTNWTIDHCVNYGHIYGTNRVGGMIGVWKYYGGTISDCVNYGAVTTYGDEGAGGMVGNFYSFTVTPARLVRCENHGLINTENKGGAGGIAGKNAGTGNALVQIERCVNTGIVKGADSAGILNSGCRVSGSSYLESCTNYGFVAGGNGIVGSGNGNSGLSVRNCLGAADLTYPVSDYRGKEESNYYISDKGGSIEDLSVFYVEKIEAPGIGAYEQMGQIVQNEKLYGKDSFASNAYFQNSSKTGKWEYIFTFSQPVKLSEICLTWNRTAQNRVTNYTVSGMQDGGTQWMELGEKNNFDVNSVRAEDLKALTDPNESISLEDSDIAVRKVKVSVNASVQINGSGVSGANVCLLKLWVKGYVADSVGNYNVLYDGTISQGSDATTGKYLIMKDGEEVYEAYPEDKGRYYYINTSEKSVNFNMQQLQADKNATVEEKGVGTPLGVSRNPDGGYRLEMPVSSGKAVMGIPGFPVNPVGSLTGSGVFRTDSSLKAAGDASDNIRYQVFEADHDYFDLAGSSGVSELKFKSHEVRFTSGENASYKASWDEVENASYYQYRIRYYGEDDGNMLRETVNIVYNPWAEIPVSSINGRSVRKIVVEVRAGTKSLIGGKLQEIWTEDWISAAQEVGDILPTPRFHFELSYNPAAEALQYLCFLDNQDDYTEFLKKQNMDDAAARETLSQIEIVISTNGWTGTLTADQTMVQENGKNKYYGGSDGNVIISAVARSKAGGSGNPPLYVTSQKTLRESQSYTNGLLTGTSQTASVTQKGFYGNTMGSLGYRVDVGKAGSYIFYMRNELTAVPDTLGVPVSLSSANVRVSDTTSQAIAVLLNRLPEDVLMEDAYSGLMVRSYPAVISNNVVYMGHTVELQEVKGHFGETGAGISGETLLQLYVTEDNQVSWEPSGTKLIQGEDAKNRKLAPGFVIELAEDGTYTLYYNTLLYYNDQVLGFQYEDAGMKTQVFYKKLDEKWNLMPEPVIHVNYDEENRTDGDVNGDSMEITWDLEGYLNESGAANYKPGAEYDYTIVGYTAGADGKEIASQIAAGYYVTGIDGENTLTFDTASWAFRRVEAGIARRGETDVSGKTTVYPSASRLEFSMKARFSQISRPTVSLTTDETGSVEKNSLLYQVVWSPVPDSERFTDAPDWGGQEAGKQDNLAYYEVEVRRSDNDTAAETMYSSKAEYDKAWKRLQVIYESKAAAFGGSAEDTEHGGRYSWTQTQQGVSVLKTMELTGSEETLTIVRDLTSLWRLPADKAGREGSPISQTVDLNEYERNENIEISVKAVAEEDREGIVIPYRDSLDGVARELMLPSRLYVPDVEQLDGMPQYGPDAFVTMKEFLDQGVMLRFEGSPDAQVQQKYEIAAAVYWTVPEDLDDYRQAAAGDDGAGSWNEDAAATLLRKADSVTMDGNAYQAEYSLDTISAQYAGRWLKVAMRGISDSNISSWWSDEDEAADETLNYHWLRLPRVQVETPGWTESAEEVYYEEQDGKWQVDGGKDSQIHVRQTSLSFPRTGYTDGYQIQLVHSLEQTREKDYYKADVDWIYLVRDGEGYQVYYLSTDPDKLAAIGPGADALEKCFLDENAVWIGTLGAEQTELVLPGSALVRQTATGRNTITISSFLRWQEGQITLVLPDALQVDYGGEVHSGSPEDPEFPNSYLNTAQASVQGRLKETGAAYYEDSCISKWYRQLVNTEYESVTETMEDYAPAPSVSFGAEDIKVSAGEELAFEWAVSSEVGKRLVYRLEVLDENDNVVHFGLGSAWVYDDQNAYRNLLRFMGDEYARYSGSRIRIETAAVAAGDNVTKWSEPVERTLPELIVQEVEKKELKDEAGTPAGMEFTWSHHAKSSEYVIILTGQGGQEYYLSTSGLAQGDYTAQWNPETGTFDWSAAETGQQENIQLHIGAADEAMQYRLTIRKDAWTGEMSPQNFLGSLSGGNVPGDGTASAGDSVSGGNGDVSGGGVGDMLPYADLSRLLQPPAVSKLRIRAVSVFKGYEPVILEQELQ